MHIITKIFNPTQNIFYTPNFFKLFQFLHMRVENKVMFYSSFYESFEQQFNIFTTAISNFIFPTNINCHFGLTQNNI